MSEWKETDLGLLPDDWGMTTLDKLVNEERGISYGVVQPGFHNEEGVPILRVNNIKDGRIMIDEVLRVDEEIEKNYQRTRLRGGELLITLVGNLGECAIATKEFEGWNVARAIGVIDLNRKKVNSEWIKYLLSTTTIKSIINSWANTTVQATLNLKELNQLPISLPPLPEQQSIAAILSSLDNKIDLLRRQNQTLEQLAQTIFKQWFVQFQYPGTNGKMQPTELGEVPKGWKIYSLGDLLMTVSSTHSFKNSDEIIFLNTSDILEGQVLHNNYTDVSILPGQAKKSIKKDDILYSEIRPENKRFAYVDFDGDDYVVSTKLMVLRAKAQVHPIVLYTYLTLPETIQILHQQAEARSGTFPQITFSQVEELLLAIPPDETLTKATNAIIPLFKKRKQNEKEIQTLTQLRDSLLPRLMSGRLRVG